MATIAFYKQVRDDGGIHTGVEVNGVTCFDRFELEGEEYDPVLTWYIEVRCEGETVPPTATGAILWLLDHATIIQNGLTQLAERLSVGLDHSTYPLDWEIPGAPTGVRMHLRCAATRRVTALAMAKFVNEVGAQWQELVRRLPESQPCFP